MLERRGNDIRFHPRIIEWAHQHPWPGDPQRTVAEVFQQEERPRLLLSPQQCFPTDRIETVSSHKTIYVTFDRNRYSIPPEAVGRTLTIAATDTSLRILDAGTVLASHPRSYDSGQEVLDPVHRDAVLSCKRKAAQAIPAGWLEQAIPEVRTLLDLAFARGESACHQTQRLHRLVEDYGVPALREAIVQALKRDTPTAASDIVFSKVLIVDYQLPSPDAIPSTREIKYIQARNEFVPQRLPQAQLDKLYDDVLYQIALRTIHELFEADIVAALAAVVFNGIVRSVDKRTGRELAACVMSLHKLNGDLARQAADNKSDSAVRFDRIPRGAHPLHSAPNASWASDLAASASARCTSAR